MQNITLAHEHVHLDLSGKKGDLDCRFDDYETLLDEYKKLKTQGVTRVIDLTCKGMGRNLAYLYKLEQESGIEIICSTGYYKDPFLPSEVDSLSVDQLAQLLISEIEDGIDGSSKKARIIGEVGSSREQITPNEQKVFRASCVASLKTGLFISTHTTLGTLGHEQLDLISSCGVKLDNVVLGHTDLKNDYDYLVSLLERGCYLAFDTIGKESYLSDTIRIDFINKLCNLGYSNKLLLSLDITRKSHLEKHGGLGYSYLLDTFVPSLSEIGISDKHLESMLVSNPLKILNLRY